jgi:hypothetical protein
MMMKYVVRVSYDELRYIEVDRVVVAASEEEAKGRAIAGDCVTETITDSESVKQSRDAVVSTRVLSGSEDDTTGS